MENNIVQNLNSEILNDSYDKEVLFENFKLYSMNIIISIEKIMYNLFTNLKIEKNLISDESEEVLFEYIRIYLSEYFKNLENNKFLNLDTQYIENINKINKFENNKIINILESIINMSYPFLIRSKLDNSNITIYTNTINEQLNEIISINKIEIIKLI